jgi:hypothetical protein
MKTSTSTAHPLVIICALVLVLCTALWAAPADARVIRVANCDDAGPGTLRNAVALASSGDLITLKQLACNDIVLTSGQIVVPQASLTLVGNRKVTVDGNRNGRVFLHSGTGTLRLESLSVANGVEPGTFVFGGCIYSWGRVELFHARVHHCTAQRRGGLEPEAYGGGIAAASVLVLHSKVYSNVAELFGKGGGIYSWGAVRIHQSQLYDNRAYEGGAVASEREPVSVSYSRIERNHADSRGGAIAAWGDATINKTTIAGNRSNGQCGALCLFGRRNLILDSTLSSNSALYLSVGQMTGDATIANSTIAFNREEYTNPNYCSGAMFAMHLHLENSILAKNTCAAGAGTDIAGEAGFSTVVGANNIVGRTSLALPSDTIRADPRLAPLADNGGPTPTHAPLPGSPAIDAGNNVFERLYDQRGPGYPRTRGPAPDIGAVEYCGHAGPHSHDAMH